MVNTVDHIRPGGKYTPTQAARALDVSVHTIYKWMHRGWLKGYRGRIKQHWYFKGVHLIELHNTL